ncbi:MAG: SDR family oxidoreductase [Desulfosalsimonas sp.]|uniref:SDR family NAD(P)-dependent oxidoreductase n=1 Tax=Desulfosalsimonas sp. TaxID=3073848 RepID=UPI003970AA8E
MDLKEKVVVVTGGASGIGAALCRCFAQNGARAVVAADMGNQCLADDQLQGGICGSAGDF